MAKLSHSTSNPNGVHPIVILLDGGDSSANRVWVETSLPTLANRYGFITVALNASANRYWNDAEGPLVKAHPRTPTMWAV